MMHYSIIDRNPFHDSDSVPLLEGASQMASLAHTRLQIQHYWGPGPVGAAKIKAMGEYGSRRKTKLSRLATGTVLGHLNATRHSRSYS
jgi:hypothetical protein